MLWPKGQPIYHNKLMLGCEEKTLGRVLPPTKFFSNKAALFTYIHSNSNYSTNITYNDKHMQITIIVVMIWKLPAPLIENNFNGVGLVLLNHLIETLHCPFSSIGNEDAAASSFCFEFVAAAWAHPILAKSWKRYWNLHNSSWLGAPILARRWQHYWYPLKHRKHL